MLQINNLKVKVAEKEILHGVNLTVNKGETHVIMGPNGAGKSTLGYAIMGNPKYEVVDGTITFKDKDITYYRTQGDNKKTNPEPDEELQTSSSIVAKYTGTKIGGVGNFLSFIRTQLGFFLCVLLPMIIFFVYEAIRVVLNIIAYNKEKALDQAKLAVDSAELTEEQKKRAIEEYLASIGENQDKAENEPEVQAPADGNSSAENSD